jgi:DnaJ-class molecular chaperone
MKPSENEITNGRQRLHFESAQDEILRIGWKGIVEKYHPDVNVEQERANDRFRHYKAVFESMKQRLNVG